MCERFKRFIRELPTDAELVLNGDTIHVNDTRGYPPDHLAALDFLREESLRRKIVWIRGNHDDRYQMPNPRNILFVPYYNIGKRLFISHGYEFDSVMPRNRFFLLLFRAFHHVRIFLGAESIHVALYAKRFPFLYNILLRYVSSNALAYAKEAGYPAVVCGHTHFIQDFIRDGIRYMNTGAWTDNKVGCLIVTDDSMELQTLTS